MMIKRFYGNTPCHKILRNFNKYLNYKSDVEKMEKGMMHIYIMTHIHMYSLILPSFLNICVLNEGYENFAIGMSLYCLLNGALRLSGMTLEIIEDDYKKNN